MNGLNSLESRNNSVLDSRVKSSSNAVATSLHVVNSVAPTLSGPETTLIQSRAEDPLTQSSNPQGCCAKPALSKVLMQHAENSDCVAMLFAAGKGSDSSSLLRTPSSVGENEEVEKKKNRVDKSKTEKAKTRIRQALGLPAATKPKGIIQAIKTIVGLSEKAKQNARTAKCCNPLPGDKITGVKTTKRKIVIHRADCKNIIGLPESKKTAVPDSLFEKGGHEVILRIEMENRPGALPEILTLISSFRITVNSTNAKLQPNNTMACLLNIQIKNISELEKLLEKTRSSKGVRKAERETTP